MATEHDNNEPGTEEEMGPAPLTEEQADQLLEQVEEQLGEDFLGLADAANEKLFKNAALPKDALGVSDEMMEGIYSHAYQMYNRGHYKDTANIFRLLIMLDFQEPKFLMGLAACLHMQKKHRSAAQMYTMTAALDVGNPMPYYHAADCFIKLDEPLSAQMMLQFAMDQAGEQADYAILKERAKLMHESLEKDVQAQREKLEAEAAQKKAKGAKAKKK